LYYKWWFYSIWYGAFASSVTAWERVFDFGNGQANDNINVVRASNTTNIEFTGFNGGTAVFTVTVSNAIVQNEFNVWAFRHNTSTRLTEILKNGVVLGSVTATQALTNKTLSNTYIGKTNWPAGAQNTNMNTAGLYVYASFLTDAQVASVSNHLMYSTTTSMPSTLPDYNNKVVRYGSLLSQGFRNGQAMYFNGNLGSYLDIQDVPNWPLTFCFWFNISNNIGTNTGLTLAALCSQDGAGNGSYGWGIQVDTSGNGTNFCPAYSTNGSTWIGMTTQTIALNTWYHIAFVVTPTTLAYYLNGSLVQSVAAIVYNTNRLVIGKSGDNGRPFNGYIADIRVFDYALRADEINAMVDSSGEERALTNYNTPKNYIVNMSNWPSIMNLYKSGSYTIYTAGSGTNTFYQLTSSSSVNSSNTVFNSTRVQNYNSFTCAFDITIDSPNGDGFYFYCGASSSTTVPAGSNTSANSSYYIYFQIAGTKGIYLYNDQGQQLAYSPLPNVITNSRFVPITIVYNRSVTNTWTVNVASLDVLTYNDPNNANWVSNIAGDFWGIGARTTSNTMFLYIRRVELSYTPFVNTINTTINAQNNVKFPPAAMTAESTTFTGTSILDGVYTATASSGVTGPPYQAFDNNTGTYWGEPTGVFGGAGGSYTGPQNTTITNLITGITSGYSGSWLQLQVPNAVSLNSFGLMGRQDQSLFTWRTPTTFYIAGSNNGSTWELIHTTSGAQYTSAMQYFTCNGGNTKKYTYFRIIVNKIGNNGPAGDPGGGNYLDIAAWDLYTQMNTVNAAVIAVPPYSMTADTTTFAGNSVYDGTYTLTSSNTHLHPEMGPRYTIFNDV